ncbi:MAG: alpha/beta fold hydrolase [Alphaproteobacteria bacterium]
MKFYSKFILAAVLLLAACTGSKPYMREEVASRLSFPAFLVKRDLPAGAFDLRVAERMHTRFATAQVYIEGDGFTAEELFQEAKDPTPRNPVALHLATRDLADNVVWIARPCQYVNIHDGGRPCNDAYWKGKRFAPEVIESYNLALDEIKKRWDIEGFNLVGFDGGGTIATLLAAQRPDVLSLRTVAGNLDTDVYARHHGIQLYGGNPVALASSLSQMPQAHWAGGQDDVVPPSVVQSYLQALGENSCVKYMFVQEAGHEEGWVDKWPEFLKDLPTCRSYRSDGAYTPGDYEPMPDDYRGRISREIPEKP